MQVALKYLNLLNDFASLLHKPSHVFSKPALRATIGL